MTENPRKERDALDRLADALADDILNVPDEDILAEADEDYGDSAKLAAETRALFERAKLEAGKARLAAAKKAVTAARRQEGAVVSIDPAEGRRRYNEIVARDSTLSAKLTMAARKGEGESERDIESAIEDLAELGGLDDDSGGDKEDGNS